MICRDVEEVCLPAGCIPSTILILTNAHSFGSFTLSVPLTGTLLFLAILEDTFQSNI